jgi:hypothetical protein
MYPLLLSDSVGVAPICHSSRRLKCLRIHIYVPAAPAFVDTYTTCSRVLKDAICQGTQKLRVILLFFAT